MGVVSWRVMDSALAVNPNQVGLVGALDALTKGVPLVLVRSDSWSDEKLVDLAKAARSHDAAAMLVGHGRLHEDLSLAGLLRRPRVFGPVALCARRWPALTIDRSLLRRDPVLDHAASWILAVLCAAHGGLVASTDTYHPRRAHHDPHDPDALRPEGRAWLSQLALRLLPESAQTDALAGALHKAWSGSR